ncbi:hypothetical protein E2F50_03110 [Rhizobium deserti]|uniref:Pectate lyase superfamily protein domain-containing protein n=1 Tax=Rhizobium deserti TaxID=2547961 RepID=A0A4R5UMN0_9HYPH|nr:hypothetical protein [Rhizobium deserti]TDK39133.1 hypothetical protein E2F50_03110 [Rhizobium deserti]
MKRALVVAAFAAARPHESFSDTMPDLDSRLQRISGRNSFGELDINGSAYLAEGSRSGIFDWIAGDHSDLIAADLEQGIYLKSGDRSATAGAWVRRFSGPWNAAWFGMSSENQGAANVRAFKAMLALAETGRAEITFPPGRYMLNEKIEVITGFSLSVLSDNAGLVELVWSNSDGGLKITFADITKPPTIRAIDFITTSIGGGTALSVVGPQADFGFQNGPALEDIDVRGSDPSRHYWQNGISLKNVWYPYVRRVDLKGRTNVAVAATMSNGLHLHNCQAPQVRDCYFLHMERGIKATGTKVEGFNLTGGEIVGVNYGVDLDASLFNACISIHDLHINAYSCCVRLRNIGQMALHDLHLYKTPIGSTYWQAIEAINCHALRIHNILLSTTMLGSGGADGVVLNGCTYCLVHDITAEAWRGGGTMVVISGGPSEKNQVRNIAPGRLSPELKSVRVSNDVLGNNRFDDVAVASRQRFRDKDATPSVRNDLNGHWQFANALPVSVTCFTDGLDGQQITVLFASSKTTLTHNSKQILRNGSDVRPPDGAIMTFRYQSDGDLWREEQRNF